MSPGDDDKARFWSKVTYEPNTGCWLWMAGCSTIRTGAHRRNPISGYGSFAYGGSNHRAHRVAWELTHGPVPDGKMVLHRCDNPKCVNAHDHLYVGDALQNAADKYQRGRGAHPIGERHRRARLTETQVMEIRSRRKSESARALAGAYGVAVSTIIDVCSGKNWSHLPYEKPPDGRKLKTRTSSLAGAQPQRSGL